MSKAKFDAAKELIEQKNYAAARAVLNSIDHPTAREWLIKLDRLDPPPPSFPIIPDPGYGKVAPLEIRDNRQTAKGRNTCGMTLAVLILAGFIYFFTHPSPVNNSQSVAATAPGDSNNAVKATAGTSVPDGSRGNPFALGQTGAIRDGRFQVNGIKRDQSAAVHKMNMFNTEPKAGQEWVLVDATFYCDLKADETCNTTVMQFDLAGDMGEVYDTLLVTVLDNKLDGEVFGGGHKQGVIGFIINSADKNLLLAVNDLGSRTFFRTE